VLFDLTASDVSVEGRYDVCIIGTGAAGITLAHKLARAGKRVALCEGGELGFSGMSQDLYQGDVVGDTYFDLDVTRLRYFGGSTNHWAGKCRPLDPVDFQRDALGPEYVWPIGHDALDRHLAEACEILEIDTDFAGAPVPVPEIDRTRFNRSPVNFAVKYGDEIEASDTIDLYVGANFMDLDGSGMGGNTAAEAVIVANYEGTRFRIPADTVVLACGGIENSRLLLWLRELHGGRFFDETTPVGRYWMEHPHFLLGEAILETELAETRNFAISGETQLARGILNCGFQMDMMTRQGRRALIDRVLCVAPRLGERFMEMADRNLVCGVQFRAAWEQAPDPDNRIVLSDSRRDRFDMPRPELHWRKRPRDRETVEASVEILDDWLRSADRGRIRLSGWMRNGEDYPDAAGLAGHHHMGGTRMGTRRDLSVTDADCRLHGSPNVYVAGSSNFTTSGHANPTLPTVQLTLRLAEHLAA
jgi:hypothetical protein